MKAVSRQPEEEEKEDGLVSIVAKEINETQRKEEEEEEKEQLKDEVPLFVAVAGTKCANSGRSLPRVLDMDK